MDLLLIYVNGLLFLPCPLTESGSLNASGKTDPDRLGWLFTLSQCPNGYGEPDLGQHPILIQGMVAKPSTPLSVRTLPKPASAGGLAADLIALQGHHAFRR